MTSSPIRRLTAREYGRTVKDLLGTATDWGATLQTDITGSGFENAVELQHMTVQQLQQFMSAAEAIATEAVRDVPKLLGCDPARGDACVNDFIARFGKRAYRRPLLPGEADVLARVYQGAAAGGNLSNGLLRLVQAVLMAPQFLYRIELGGSAGGGRAVKLTSWEMASRLSYLFTGTMPDAPLAAAADGDRLQSKADVLAQAQRLIADPRASALLGAFDDQWLGLGRLSTLEKDAKTFPGYTAGISGLQHDEVSRFVEDAFWKPGGSLGALFTAAYTFRNAALARYYGEPLPASGGNAGSPMVRVDTDPKQRSGLFSQGGLVALISGIDVTNPVTRGKYVRTQLLCDGVPPPPPTVNQRLPDLPGRVTARQRFAAHSQDPGCAACHRLMDPIGIGLESFDATGRWRTTDNGLPVDATGELSATDVDGPFTGPGELGNRLAGSAKVHRCVASSWFRYAFGRSESPADACTIDELGRTLEAAGLAPRELLVALTQTDAFYYRALPEGVAP